MEAMADTEGMEATGDMVGMEAMGDMGDMGDTAEALAIMKPVARSNRLRHPSFTLLAPNRSQYRKPNRYRSTILPIWSGGPRMCAA